MQDNKDSSQKEKKDLSVKLKENWFIVFIISSFVIVTISLIIQSIITQQIPIQENTWNGVTPGYSKYKDLVENMGIPIDKVETETGFDIKYQSDFLALPHEVVTDKEGTVSFIKEYLLYDPTHLLSQYVEDFGEPEIVLFDDQSGTAFKAHVFLDEGLVIIAHIKDGSVEQKWYFEPVSKEIFLKSWGKTLSEKGLRIH
ncbi:MAG: hypothetical protein OEX81_04530 [Candidatus Pacebacteria bacterium]|nr:hypothetical protein [Candidatus Paceibacterota bacterium]